MNKGGILIAVGIVSLGAIGYFLIKKHSSTTSSVPNVGGTPTLPSGFGSPANPPNPLFMPSDPIALAHDATPLVFSPISSSSSINEEGTVASNPSPSPSIITVASNPSSSPSPTIHTSGSSLIGRRVFIT
jgi:hypothetical protein